MNTMLLVAFGLVALGALIRLILLLTAPKDHHSTDSAPTPIK